jgi:hypothetical protein
MSTKTEPTMTAGVVAAVVGLLVAYGIVNELQGAAWAAFGMAVVVPLAQAWWTRRHVIPVDTIRNAGLNPERVKDRAENPGIPRNTEGEHV